MTDLVREEEEAVTETRKLKKKIVFHRNTEWWTTSSGNPVTCIQVRNDTMMTGSIDRVIKVWDLSDGGSRCSHTLFSHKGPLRCLQFDDEKIVSGSDDCSVKFWSRQTLRCTKTIGNLPQRACSLNFDAKLLVVGCQDGSIFLYSSDGTSVGTLSTENAHEGPVWSVKVFGNEILSGSFDRLVKLWDAETRQLKLSLSGHQHIVTSVDRVGDIVASASLDKTVRIWDLRNPKNDRCVRELDQNEGAVGCVVMRDVATVISGSADEFVRVWDVATGDIIREWPEDGQVNCISSEGNRIAVGTRTNISVYDVNFTSKKKK